MPALQGGIDEVESCVCVYEVLMHVRDSVTISPLRFILAFYKLLFWQHNVYQIGSKHVRILSSSTFFFFK